MVNKWPNDAYIDTILIEVGEKHVMFRLPVNPEEEGFNGPVSWVDRDVIEKGEISFPLYPKSRTITINSFFPRQYDPSYCVVAETELWQPMNYVDILEEAKRTVIHVIITELKINGRFTIRSFNWKAVGGELGDIYYTLELKEYNMGQIRKFSGSIVPTSPGVPEDLPGSPRSAPHVPVPEDEDPNQRPPEEIPTGEIHIGSCVTMASFAQATWNDASLWYLISSVNPKIQFEDDENVIKNCATKPNDELSQFAVANKILKAGQLVKYPLNKDDPRFKVPSDIFGPRKPQPGQ